MGEGAEFLRGLDEMERQCQYYYSFLILEFMVLRIVASIPSSTR